MGARAGHLGIHRNRLDQLIKHYCELAGIRREKAHMHVLKHSCGTQLASMGESAHVIQDWLGHVNSQSTDVYMHFTSKMRDEAYERLKGWK
jgi:site-specific recombinase XerD